MGVFSRIRVGVMMRRVTARIRGVCRGVWNGLQCARILRMSRARQRVLSAATDLIRNMRATADRLEKAVRTGDMATISEIQLSQTSWTLDAVRGAAWAVVSSEENS